LPLSVAKLQFPVPPNFLTHDAADNVVAYLSLQHM